MRQLHFNRSVRYGPNSPARGGFRLNIGVVDWPVGVPVAFCIWFDVEKRLLRLTDREGKDVATSLTVKDMAYSKYLHRLLELGLSEGLIDKDEAERGRASRQLSEFLRLRAFSMQQPGPILGCPGPTFLRNFITN